MKGVILAFPILTGLFILQTVVISRLPLLHGTADLILVVLIAWGLQERVTTAWVWAIIAGVLVSFVSAVPLFIPLAGYLLVNGAAQLLHRRIWQTPILAMFAVTIFGTVAYHSLVLVVLNLWGTPLPWRESFALVV
ncbi:MAG: hypothetical protein U1B80_03100, partial [Anaerolineaceae bacterium]|nr:hypothetical protein [Anaerolineaceae bacterium]